MAASSAMLPDDPQLAGALALTDSSAVTDLLADTLGSFVPGPGQPRYLEHRPGHSWLVQHRFDSPAGLRDLVVSIGRRTWTDTALRSVRPWHLDGQPAVLAGTVGDVTFAWYPADPGLPHLADVASAFGLAGPVDRLAWVPQQRAVFGIGDRVVKLDADPSNVAAGVATLRALGGVMRVPAVLGERTDIGAFMQERLVGTPLGRRDAVQHAPAAGRLLARVHAVDPAEFATLETAPGEDHLRAWPHVSALVCHAAPDLAARVAALADALAASAPVGRRLVASHGDFNVGQLLDLGSDGLGLVDTDTMCLATPAFDLASYATNLLSGRPDDLRHAFRVLDPLLGGYGSRPAGVAWMLAATAFRRIDRPIRRAKKRWRARVEQLVSDVELLTGRIGDGG